MKISLIKIGLFVISAFLAFTGSVISFGEISYGKEHDANGKNIENAEKESQSAFAPETHYKFAPVYEGSKIKHGFAIMNRGTGPLRIKKVVLP